MLVVRSVHSSNSLHIGWFTLLYLGIIRCFRSSIPILVLYMSTNPIVISRMALTKGRTTQGGADDLKGANPPPPPPPPHELIQFLMSMEQNRQLVVQMLETLLSTGLNPIGNNMSATHESGSMTSSAPDHQSTIPPRSLLMWKIVFGRSSALCSAPTSPRRTSSTMLRTTLRVRQQTSGPTIRRCMVKGRPSLGWTSSRTFVLIIS